VLMNLICTRFGLHCEKQTDNYTCTRSDQKGGGKWQEAVAQRNEKVQTERESSLVSAVQRRFCVIRTFPERLLRLFTTPKEEGMCNKYGYLRRKVTFQCG
jgi:hypothetical protein